MTAEEALADLEGATGRVLLVGDADTGKSTFAREAVRQALARGRRVALLDADIGQSEVGPPGCIGLALPRSPEDLGERLPARRLYFVGSTSPVGFFGECLAGVSRLAREAERLEADVTFIDTTGLVRGALGYSLKVLETDALAPDRVLAFQRGAELRRLLQALPGCRTSVVDVGPEVRSKPPQLRTLRRQQRWADYLEDARPVTLSLRRLSLRGTRMGQGRPLTREGLRKLTSDLEARLVYAENQGTVLWGISDARPEPAALSKLADRAGTRTVELAPRTGYTGLIVGLLDDDGLTLALGVWQGLDSLGLRARILAPPTDPDRVHGLSLGVVRIGPDGAELRSVPRGRL